MSKITCATCYHEKDRFCREKKIGVSINKRRNCSEYFLEYSKVKEKQVIKTVKMSYKKKEELKRRYKEQLKQLKQNGPADPGTRTADPMHPLTGDLSRFVSTASDDE